MPSTKTWCRKGATRFLIALVAGLLVACSPEDSGNARDVADVGKSSFKFSDSEGSGSIYGNYLAGRFAETESDLDFAANMMERVLEENPSDQEILRRTFVLELSAGHGKRAAELAERLLKLGNTMTSASLLLAGRDLKAGKLDAALKLADEMSDSGLSRFSKPIARAWIFAAMKKYDEALKALDPLAPRRASPPCTACTPA